MGIILLLLGISLTAAGFAKMAEAKKHNVAAVGWMIMGIIGILVTLSGISRRIESV